MNFHNYLETSDAVIAEMLDFRSCQENLTILCMPKVLSEREIRFSKFYKDRLVHPRVLSTAALY